MAALDLDKQHGPDLLGGSKSQGAAVSWLQAPPQADDFKGWLLYKLRDAGWIMSLMPYDMDGDGDPDAVLSDRKGEHTGVFWLETPGQWRIATMQRGGSMPSAVWAGGSCLPTLEISMRTGWWMSQ